MIRSLRREALPERTGQLLCVGEELDLLVAPEFERQVRACLANGDQLVVVDLSRTEFLDSLGARALLRVAWNAREDGWLLLLIAPAGPARRTIERLGLQRFFTIYDRREDALVEARRAVDAA